MTVGGYIVTLKGTKPGVFLKMKIVTGEEMRRIERACAAAGSPPEVLMEKAGKAVAEETERILGDIERQRVLLLIGPGNNGGDGLVAARYLHDRGAGVSVFLAGRRPADDPNLQMVRERGIHAIEAESDQALTEFDKSLSGATGVIDALFGTGRVRPFQGVFREVLEKTARAKETGGRRRIIAIDLPSGVDADSGAADPASLYADNTIVLGYPKPGLFRFPGAAMTGKLSVVDIGIPDYLAESITTEMMTGKWAQKALPERPPDANKGSFGKVLVVAGSLNYVGAACLACLGAMRSGAGLVTLATAESLLPIMAAKLTEVTHLPLPEADKGNVSPEAAGIIARECLDYKATLAGCGLGRSAPTTGFIRGLLLGKRLPGTVIDADALNALAGIADWWQKLPDDAILTPHPGEMTRLTGRETAVIQADRTGTAREFARKWQKIIVLKGAFTVVAAPDGRVMVNPAANPGLASAGTGDVLAGTIAGLRAQGVKAYEAAALGAYLHGRAGEEVRERLGDAGMIASDLLGWLPVVIRQIKEQNRAENAAGN